MIRITAGPIDMFASEAGLSPEIAELNGMSGREVLAEADRVLGGAATPFPVDDKGTS